MEQDRTKALKAIETHEIRLVQARQKMVEAVKISNTAAGSFAKAQDALAKLEAVMAADALDEAGKKALGQAIESS